MSVKALKNGRAALVAAAICAATASSSAFAEYVAQGDFTIGKDVAAEVGTYDSTTYTVTLADDVTIDGKLTIADGVTIDLAGHKLTAAGFESANIVVNGDFETDPMMLDGSAEYAISDWKYLAASGTKGEVDSLGNQTYVADWTWEGWSNPYHGAGLCKPGSTFANSALRSVGKYAAFIHGTGSSGRYLAQELPAVSAGVYKWSFKYASRSSYPNWGFKFDFLLEKGGASTKLGNTISPTAASPWKTPSGTVTIDEAGAYTLKFKINSASKNSDNYGGAVFDNVVLKKVSVITDSGTGTPGELHIAGGADALGDVFTVEGNLKVVLHEQTIDGDFTANVDTVLAGDVTVNGTITMAPDVKLDLNGNELTAQGIDGDPSADWATYLHDDLTKPADQGGTIKSDCALYDSTYKIEVAFKDNFTVAGDKDHRILYDMDNGPFWVTYDFGEGNLRKVTSYKVWFGQSAGSSYANRAPKKWILYASNDNNHWTEVDSRSSETGWTCPKSGTAAAREYSCYNPGAYRYYRWKCTANNGTAGGRNFLEFVQLEYFGTVIKPVITDTSADTANRGKLRLAVPENTTLTNSKVAINGNLDFVKDGDGTYTCATADLMTYLGDTYINGGTYLCGLDGSQHPLGGGNVVVNGDFEDAPSSLEFIGSGSYKYASADASVFTPWIDVGGGAGIARSNCSTFFTKGQNVGKYAAFLHTHNGAASNGRNIYQDLYLDPGKYKWSFRYAKRPGNSYGATPFNFNLIQKSTSTTKTLKSLTPSSSDFDSASGTVEVSEAGAYRLQFIATTDGNNGSAFDDVVFERIPEVHIASGATLDLNGKSGFGNYKFAGEGGTIINSGSAISENLVVSGVFAPVATTGSFGVVLQDGATLDITKWTGAFPIASPAISFASGAAITVNLAGRRVGPYIYIVKWDSIPSDVTFTLDPEAAGRYKVKAKGDGLMLVRKGFMIMVM